MPEVLFSARVVRLASLPEAINPPLLSSAPLFTSLFNQQGVIASAGALQLNGSQLNNDAGSLQSGSTLDVNVQGGSLTNRSGGTAKSRERSPPAWSRPASLFSWLPFRLRLCVLAITPPLLSSAPPLRLSAPLPDR